MACYAALASLVHLLEDTVHRRRYQDLPLDGQTMEMNSLLIFFQGLLRDCDEAAAANLDSRIRDVAYQTQDMIELEIYWEILFKSLGQTRRVPDKFFQDLKKVEHQIGSLAQDMSAIGRRTSEDSVHFPETSGASEHYPICLKTIEDQPRRQFSLCFPSLRVPTRNFSQAAEQKIASLAEETSEIEQRREDSMVDCSGASEQYPIGRNTIVGFDEYLETMKYQLCGQSSRLQIIPIIGMAGIGKTTLARIALDDALIVHHFDCRGWATVSQDYHVNWVLQGLKKSMNMTPEGVIGEDEIALKNEIYKCLYGRRYCIVVDDIWSTQVWDDLKSIFPDDNNGSRIVLTSRLEDVATYCGTSGFCLKIQTLNEEESWKLLEEVVFAPQHCPLEVEATGKLIAKKCGGLPLAIVVIAGILTEAKTLRDWEKIATSMSSILYGTEDGFTNILSLSYNHLPHKLKACLLYMGNFPEDYEIHISRLILLWIAEGFIESKDGSKSSKKVGEECLEDLVRRNLVLVTHRNSRGQFKLCAMHDLTRDFCKQRALSEQFFHPKNEKGYSSPRSMRCISLYNSSMTPQASKTGKLVRSIISFGDANTDGGMVKDVDAFGSFILLRTLDLLGLVCSKFPKVVLQLYLLKFLALKLRGYGRTSLPSSFSLLQNLQTLIVACSIYVDIAVVQLPVEIWKMPQLWHLKIDHIMIPAIPHTVAAEGLNLSLQTLSLLQQFTFTKEAIAMIRNLIKLKIGFDGKCNEWNLYGLSHLSDLGQLEELSITFYHKRCVESLPANFAFPQKLKKLCLSGCKLPWECLSAVGSLSDLQVLKLRQDALVGEEWEPIEGEFICLKVLLMEELDLKSWQVDTTHFPRLEHLVIRKCADLEKIPLEIGDIPTLKFIDVYRSMSAGESALQIREEQLDLGNDELQVRVRS